MDLSEAFDVINHGVLLEYLLDGWVGWVGAGVCGTILRLMRSFLSDRVELSLPM